MSTPARTRMAPSPTGHFHIGGARTALYDYLLARKTGGQFILRIEDTDLGRSDKIYQDELIEALHWLGLQWDEGPDVGGPHAPYTQSLRKDLHMRVAERLVAQRDAFYCFCTPERLEEMRQKQKEKGQQVRYDGHCRSLTQEEAMERALKGEKYVIRFMSPKLGKTHVVDGIRGESGTDNATIDDFILVKSDGMATYHLAAMVDDHYMKITHVLRGNEWLSSLPKHALIIRALKWPSPEFYHLSVFLKPDGKGKMSKRDTTDAQSTFVLGLRKLGYVPEAVLNWIALMGCSFGDKEELLTLEDMVQKFDLKHLSAANAQVNFQKLSFLNKAHIKRMSVERLAFLSYPFVQQYWSKATPEHLVPIMPLIKERIATLADIWDMAGFFFEEPTLKKDSFSETMTFNEVSELLGRVGNTIMRMHSDVYEPEMIRQTLTSIAESRDIKPADLFRIIRVALTGKPVSPPLFETMYVLGQEQTALRLLAAEGLFV